jgi:chromatin remodeling complex protein RSC6
MHTYIKEHDLQCTEDRKFFTVDTTLAGIFSIAPQSTIAYFQMPTLLKVHYIGNEGMPTGDSEISMTPGGGEVNITEGAQEEQTTL